MPSLPSLSSLVICPSCGDDVQAQNNGCPHCGYQYTWPDGTGRILSVAEVLAAPSYPANGNLELNQVSPRFLARLSEAVAARADALDALERVAEQLRAGGASLPAPEPKGTLESATTSGLCIALAIVEAEKRALKDEGPCGCHYDLEPGMRPDNCVIDAGKLDNCILAKPGMRKEDCNEWRPIKVMS